MMRVLLSLFFVHWCVSFRFGSFRKLGGSDHSLSKLHLKESGTRARASPKVRRLLPFPRDVPSLQATFFNTSDDTNKRFILCDLLTIAEVDGNEYGVGFPSDMPVMLTYCENNEYKPVLPDYPDYENLIGHVAKQLEDSELFLFKSPIVLTLQGEFEDEQFNYVDPFEAYYSKKDNIDNFIEPAEENMEEMSSVNELLEAENLTEESFESTDLDDEDEEEDDDDDDDDDDDEDDDEDDNYESEDGSINGQGFDLPDITVIPATPESIAAIPQELIVTEEDTKSLKRAHRKADRIMEYATDIKLMGSFHYCKQNYHLVRLLEPIFVMGKKMSDSKDQFYSLLEEAETERVRPIIEKLLQQKNKQAAVYEPEDADFGSTGGGDYSASSSSAVSEIYDGSSSSEVGGRSGSRGGRIGGYGDSRVNKNGGWSRVGRGDAGGGGGGGGGGAVKERVSRPARTASSTGAGLNRRAGGDPIVDTDSATKVTAGGSGTGRGTGRGRGGAFDGYKNVGRSGSRSVDKERGNGGSSSTMPRDKTSRLPGCSADSVGDSQFESARQKWNSLKSKTDHRK